MYNQINNFAFFKESDAIMKESSEVKCMALSPNRAYIASSPHESLKLWEHLGDFECISIALANKMVWFIQGGVTGLIKKLHFKKQAGRIETS